MNYFSKTSNKSMAWFYDLQIKNDMPTPTEMRHTLAFAHAARRIKKMTPKQLAKAAALQSDFKCDCKNPCSCK